MAETSGSGAPERPGTVEKRVNAKTRRAKKGAGRVKLASLTHDPRNARKHPDRNLAMIAESLERVGPARSIVIDERNVVLAGEGVTRAAPLVGLSKVRIVDARADEIIAVRRKGLTAEQKTALALYDNRAGELSQWNAEELKSLGAEGVDLKPFFTEREQKAIMGLKSSDEVVENQELHSQFIVMVTCADEAEQVALLERLSAEGLTCKALVS